MMEAKFQQTQWKPLPEKNNFNLIKKRRLSRFFYVYNKPNPASIHYTVERHPVDQKNVVV